MKVLLVVSSSKLAGTERHVVDLAAGLRDAGVTVEAVCEPGGDGLDAALERRGIPVHAMALTGAGLPAAVRRLARRSVGFDLLHAHLTHAAAASVAARALVGRPVVETRHFIALAHEDRGLVGRRVGRLRRSAIARGVDLTIAPSEAVARQVTGEVAVVPHGVETGGAPNRTTWASRFVTVGRLEDDRRVDLAIEGFAAAGLPSSSTLTVVGDGSRRAALERRAEELGVRDRVVFTGRTADVASLLADADAFLATATEAFGLAALEAMAAGLPVVAVRTGGVAELVVDGRTGLAVDAHPEAFAKAITELDTDRTRAREMGAAGRRRAHEELTAERMVERTVAVYRRVAQRSGRGPKVLRVYHSAVVPAWRERDRELRRLGVDLSLVAPRAWREGSQRVVLRPGDDTFVTPARTFGHHPARFVYNPVPLWRLLRRHRFDVIDAHEEPYSLAAAEVRLLARPLQPDARLLLYSAQNLAKRYPWPFRHLEARTLAAASAVYVCNQAAGEVLVGKGFSGEIRVLGLGVDVERFAPRDETVGGGDFTVGYVGRLTPEKGVDVLLRATAGESGWCVVIAGDGPERGALERLADGAAADVVFLGSVPHDDLPARYRSFDVVVVPSRPSPGWLEQFCRVAVEAMATAVPVVASASGALPEVVGQAGVLVPPDDVAALRGALRSLADDPAERVRLGQVGRRRSADYSWPAVAAVHHELYERARCASTS